MKLIIILISTILFTSSLFSDTSPRITTADKALGEIDKIHSNYGTDFYTPNAILSMENDTLLIGDPSYNNNTGAVYVYIYNKVTAQYDKVSTITAANGAVGDKFGYALVINNGLIAIGSPYANHGGENRGLVYLLRKPSTGWTDIECDYYFASVSENNNDFFGKSIALDSQTMAISSPGDNGYQGAVFVYERGATQLTYKAKLTGSYEEGWDIDNENDSPNFGASIAIDNDTIVVGCPNTYYNRHYVGGAYVYAKPAFGWETTTENAILSPWHYSVPELLGKNVAIENNTIALVASHYSHGLYIYEKPLTGWEDNHEDATVTGNYDLVDSVVISNNTIYVGVARHYDTKKGILNIYKKSSSGWYKYGDIQPYDQLNTDYYSRTIIKSGKNIVIGVNSNSEGKVYIFNDVLTENTIENKKDIITFTDDSDDYEPYHYSLLVGEDADLFTFGNGYGNLKFKNNPDFETPQSSHGNNLYTARIQISDQSGPLRAYHIAIKVSDIADESGLKKAISFNELTKLKASTPDKNSKYGYSVAIDGDTAVVGAHDEGGYNVGLVYVYERNTATNIFEQKAKLISTYESLNEHLGISVAIKNNIIVAGADKYLRKISDDNYIETGAALVYVKPENGWENAEQTYVLYASDGHRYDLFGKSVAINSDTIVVGAPNNDNIADDAGAVYIFDIKKLNSNEYSSIRLTCWASTQYDHFGESVAVDEDTIVVGVPYGYTNDVGMVYLYKKPLWGWKTTDQYSAYLDPDTHAGDMFGYRVAIANDIIAASSLHDDTENGSVYLFKKPIYSWNNHWLAVPNTAKLTASDASRETYFGSSIAMNANTIVIGAENADSSNSAQGPEDTNGAIYIFDKPSSGWTNAHENKKLINVSNEKANAFGCSVGISGKSIIAGSYGDDSDRGTAVIFYTDIDNDGITNDIDPDDDNDGVLDINDAFPNDASESVDTDHDGIGNNADTDDDNDGISDALETANGLNPLDASDAQTDLDNDGFTNAIEIIAGSDIRDTSSKPIWAPILMGDILIFVPYFDAN